MNRLLAFVLAFCAFAGCTSRSLSAGDSDGGMSDLSTASADHGATADLSTPSPDDLATPLAGVGCGGGVTCGSGQACCITGDTPSCVTPQQGGGTGGPNAMCMGGIVLGCDGPEDRTMGRVCVAYVADDGTLVGSRCRMQVPNNDFALCHTDTDCGPGLLCVPVITSTPSDPSLGVCASPGT